MRMSEEGAGGGHCFLSCGEGGCSRRGVPLTHSLVSSSCCCCLARACVCVWCRDERTGKMALLFTSSKRSKRWVEPLGPEMGVPEGTLLVNQVPHTTLLACRRGCMGGWVMQQHRPPPRSVPPACCCWTDNNINTTWAG